MDFHPSVLSEAPWSISKAGVIQNCARAFRLIHIEKKPKAPKHHDSKLGTVLHEIMEVFLKAPDADFDTVVAEVVAKYELTTEELAIVGVKAPALVAFCKRLQVFKQANGVVHEWIEQKFAITHEGEVCGFFDNVVVSPTLTLKGGLIRGVVDHAMLTQDNVLIILDHKTGKPKPTKEYTTQFNAYRLMARAKFPQVSAIQCGVHHLGAERVEWMDHPDGTTRPWTLAEVDRYLRPWLPQYLNSLVPNIETAQREATPPKLGPLCAFCDVSIHCPEGTEEAARWRAKWAAKKSKATL
jgi:hypothetical protein